VNTERRSGSGTDDDVSRFATAEARLAELEWLLRRIALEIEAAGLTRHEPVLPDPHRIPELRDLSPQQLLIINRLIWGLRVPQIASEMFLSQSTIRNHLSMVFRKLGVHSQAELIERLRPNA
jgi:DNA-binding NarL/FixJ family response regulator